MTEIVRIVEPQIVVVQADQPGLPGPPGPGGTDPDALHVTQHLSEFVTPTQKQLARANLELDVIDAGRFF